MKEVLETNAPLMLIDYTIQKTGRQGGERLVVVVVVVFLMGRDCSIVK